MPPPSTTATSGNSARSPSSFVKPRSDLVERAVHEHHDGEVVAAALVVDRVAVRLPPGDPGLLVDRVVVEPLVDRDAGEQLVECDRQLGDRILLLRSIESRDRVVDDRVEVELAARL